MVLLDVFKGSAFDCASLTASINKLPYKPTMLGSKGIFTPKSINTGVAMIEEKNGKLGLVPASARGTNTTVNSQAGKKARAFAVPHLSEMRTVMADDVLGVRAFGSETELDQVNTLVNDKIQDGMNNLETTREYHRAGAIQGIVLDADGSDVLYNWFDEFGIVETEIDIDLTDATANLRAWVNSCTRSVIDSLGADMATGIQCAMGNTAWDAFVTHPSVTDAYHRWEESLFLRQGGTPYTMFNFMGVDFYNYRGTVGDVKFVPDAVCRFYAVGTGNIFMEVNAPADYIETVGTPGKAFYAKQQNIDFDKGVEIETQSNPLMICTRPASLVKATATVPALLIAAGVDIPKAKTAAPTTKK